jgi:hypothetical protein
MKIKIIKGWEHSNLWTLAKNEIWCTLAGKNYRVSVGGLFCEVIYK